MSSLGIARTRPAHAGRPGEQSVDVGGSYRVTRNFDLTAGVRYSRIGIG
jgi:hypothetical protein